MIRRFCLMVFLVLLLNLIAVPQTVDGALQPYQDSDAYEVYAEFLSTASMAVRTPLVISSETVFISPCLEPKGSSNQLLFSAIADYRKQNEKTYRLRRDFALKNPYELISKEEVHTRFQRPGGGAAIELSAVGFNSNRSIAVLWADSYCGGLCGSGTFHVFQKKSGKWEPMSWKGTSCVIAS